MTRRAAVTRVTNERNCRPRRPCKMVHRVRWLMDQITPQLPPENSQPHSESARLEELIEELSLKLETCRKYAVAALAAMGLGAVMLGAGLFGVIALDPVTFLAAAAALMGGIVLAGSNRSTKHEVEAQ